MRLLIGAVGGTRICSDQGADVIFRMALDAVIAIAVWFVAVCDYLAGSGGVF